MFVIALVKRFCYQVEPLRLLAYRAGGSTMVSSQRKLGTLIFLAIISVFVVIPVFAFQNEPDGFRGIEWAANISALTDMLIVESGKDSEYYCRKNDKMKIGDADIDQISYGFYKNRFYVVLVEYHGFLNFTKLKTILLEQYGKPDQPNRLMENYFWFGGTVDIYFDYNEIFKKGYIYYSFRPIQQERARKR
jgi:hypothetical protein